MNPDDGPVSAHDVAREIAARLPNIGEVKLHKLLYYCQGLHVAWTGHALFSEPVEAWANGPVVAELWRDKKHGRDLPPPADLDSSGLGTVGYVVSRYGALTGIQLIRLTHTEDPWRDATERSGREQGRGDEEITLEALTKYFTPDRDAEGGWAERLLERDDIREAFLEADEALAGRAPVKDSEDDLRSLLESN